MEKNEILLILERLKILLSTNNIYETKLYLDLEIDNLKGTIPKECRQSKHKYYFCKHCRNFNCINNMSKGGELDKIIYYKLD